jgi:hypothetical protein
MKNFNFAEFFVINITLLKEIGRCFGPAVLHVNLVLPPVNCICEDRVIELVCAAVAVLTRTGGCSVRISTGPLAILSKVFHIFPQFLSKMPT